MNIDRRLKHVGDVARYRLCLGCGACFSVCPSNKIRLVDFEEDGIRPVVQAEKCNNCDVCLRVCPGIETAIKARPEPAEGSAPNIDLRWGQVLEIWEGYAGDVTVRYEGSSGGLCTALSLFCIESGIAGGVLHVGVDAKIPWRNVTKRSSTRQELLANTGSRYSPASPCDSLTLVENAKADTVFLGKPCDVAGLSMAAEEKPNLKRKVALRIGFFCAGTPSTSATLKLLERKGVDKDAIKNFRYRGMGWPGKATVTFKDPERKPVEMSYDECWGFVQKYRPLRCYLCPDSTAEFADISVGDPWYRTSQEKELGRSLILVRTEKGRSIFSAAVASGYVIAERIGPEAIVRSQKGLLRKRQEIWGRLIALKALGIPYPRLDGFQLFKNWQLLSAGDKIRSILGTVRRAFRRNYFKALPRMH